MIRARLSLETSASNVSSRPRVRALVLAAGYGTRLRPLTHRLPKPLLPVVGVPVADRTLEQLSRVGCQGAVLNVHHLASLIPPALGERRHGISLRYAPENRILGTLGPLVAARDDLRESDVVLMVNGDALCAWPFASLIRRHLASGAAATLLVHAGVDPREYGGGIGIDRQGRVVALRDMPPIGDVAKRRVFTGVHALSPRLLDQLVEGPGDIVSDLYIPMLRTGQPIATVATRRRWHDLGTPLRYWRGVLHWARGPWPRMLWRGNRTAPEARITADARVRTSVLEHGAVVESGSRVAQSVLLENSRIGPGCDVRSCLIGPGVELENAHLSHQLVTRKVPGVNQSAEGSVLGSLVYTPLSSS